MSAVVAPPTSNVPISIRLADLAAEHFKDIVYTIMDSHRNEIAQFFHPNALIIWDGNAVSTPANINAFFTALPPTKHTITSLDVQPISQLSTTPQSGIPWTSLLISVGGTVIYGIDTGAPYRFFHSFIVEQAPPSNAPAGVPMGGQPRGHHYIVSFTCRTAS